MSLVDVARDELANRWRAPSLEAAAAAEQAHIREWQQPPAEPVQVLRAWRNDGGGKAA